MAALVENIVSLENEANAILAQARSETREIEKSGVAEAEAYRRRLAEETDQKVLAFQREIEERHKGAVAGMEKELAQALGDMDRIPDETMKDQVHRIVSRFSEL